MVQMKKPNFKGKPYVFSVKIWLNRALLPQFIALFLAKKTQNFRRYGLPKLGPAGHFSIVGSRQLRKHSAILLHVHY